MQFTGEFVHHFDICNRYGFARPWRDWDGKLKGWDFKAAFYAIKNRIILEYGRFDGYDLQRYFKYRSYWAQLYYYDMVHDYYESTPPAEWANHLYDHWNNDGDDDYAEINYPLYVPGKRNIDTADIEMRIISSGDSMVRCVSQHQHVLERWIIQTEIGQRTYHHPIDEFHYLAFKTNRHPVLVKHSPSFGVYASMCKSTVNHVRDEKTPDGINPFQSLKWLIHFARENGITLPGRGSRG